MSILGYVALFVITVILQKTFAPLFSIGTIKPDFILILVIAVSLQHGSFWGVVAGFSAGLTYDFTGTEFVGLSALAKSVSGYLAGFFGAERLERGLTAVAGFLLAVVIIHDVIFFGVLSIGTDRSFWSALFKNSIPTAFYTLIFVIIIHLVWPRLLWGKTR